MDTTFKTTRFVDIGEFYSCTIPHWFLYSYPEPYE